MTPSLRRNLDANDEHTADEIDSIIDECNLRELIVSNNWGLLEPAIIKQNKLW
ncbi:MAG: hypothetical protein FWH42_03190 [Dehalococcoidia bacterium]|nr:hypothetical protein [Dehalococcoidia bacterium]